MLAYRIFRGVGENVDPDKNLMVRAVRKVFPVTSEFHEGHWFVKQKGTRYVTPLFLCLVAIVFADIAFAIDSIPAAFAITRDGFLIWMGNVFALLGLRALFVLVEGLIARFRYLDETIAVVLGVVGIKLLAEDLYKVGPVLSLVIIFVLFAIGIAASLWADSRDPDAEAKREERKENLQPSEEPEEPSRLLLQALPEVVQAGVPAPADRGHPGHGARQRLGGQPVAHLAAARAWARPGPTAARAARCLATAWRVTGSSAASSVAVAVSRSPSTLSIRRRVGSARASKTCSRSSTGRLTPAPSRWAPSGRPAAGVSVTRSALPSPRSTISNSTREDSWSPVAAPPHGQPPLGLDLLDPAGAPALVAVGELQVAAGLELDHRVVAQPVRFGQLAPHVGGLRVQLDLAFHFLSHVQLLGCATVMSN